MYKNTQKANTDTKYMYIIGKTCYWTQHWIQSKILHCILLLMYTELLILEPCILESVL